METLKKERSTLEEVRAQVRVAHVEAKESISQAALLKVELDQIRTTASSLTQDYGRIRDTSREARDHTTAAMAMVKEVETKLNALGQLQELSRGIEERLNSLNALAEHVSRKGKGREPAAGRRTRRRSGQPRERSSGRWTGKITEGEAGGPGGRNVTTRREDHPRCQRASVVTKTQQVQRDNDKCRRSCRPGEAVQSQVDTLAIRKKESRPRRAYPRPSSVSDAEFRLEPARKTRTCSSWLRNPTCSSGSIRCSRSPTS
jgi:hypothetical protein